MPPALDVVERGTTTGLVAFDPGFALPFPLELFGRGTFEPVAAAGSLVVGMVVQLATLYLPLRMSALM